MLSVGIAMGLAGAIINIQGADVQKQMAAAEQRSIQDNKLASGQNIKDLAYAGYRQYAGPFDRFMYQTELRTRAYIKNNPGQFEKILTAGIVVTGVAVGTAIRRRKVGIPKP